MPHDSKGQIVQDGAFVTLRAKVTNVSSGEKACNCTYVVEVPPGVDEDYAPSFSANTRLGTLERESVRDTVAPHPAMGAILQFFAFSHLPPHLQSVSKLFHDLALTIAAGPSNAEATVALRKLLEAKDAAVRAVLFKS